MLPFDIFVYIKEKQKERKHLYNKTQWRVLQSKPTDDTMYNYVIYNWVIYCYILSYILSV